MYFGDRGTTSGAVPPVWLAVYMYSTVANSGRTS
jgi:hypothetical protein